MKQQRNITGRELYLEFQNKPHGNGFVSFALEVVSEDEAAGKSVTFHYRTTIYNFLLFTNGNEVSFEDFNSELIVRYCVWLHGNGIKGNTISKYLISLRAIYNKAVKRGIIGKVYKSPFSNDKVKNCVATGSNLLTLAELTKIKNADFPHKPKLSFARDILLFSIYMHGMELIDIVRLKDENIHDGVITYQSRSSDGAVATVNFQLTKPISDIINRYNKAGQPYIFPILSGDDSSAGVPIQVEEAARRINGWLETAAKLLDIKKKITLKSALDVWAYNKGAAIDFSEPSSNAQETENHNKVSSAKDNSKALAYEKRLEAKWLSNYDAYIKFIKENNRPLLLSDNSKLYLWRCGQIKLYRTGKMSEHRSGLFKRLLSEIDKAKEKYAEAKRIKREEERKIIAGKFKSDTTIPIDDLWNAKWRAYVEYMEKNHACPSKYKAEDMVLFDWYKHSRKLLRHGLMKSDRIEKFRQLLDETAILRHANQQRHDEDSPSTEMEKQRNGTDNLSNSTETVKKWPSKWDMKWQRNYDSLMNFIDDHGALPKSQENPVLAVWFYRQRKLYQNGSLPVSREETFLSMMSKIANLSVK